MAGQAKFDWTLSRRTMLQLLGALGVSSTHGLIGGCSDSSSGAGSSRDAGDAGISADAGHASEAGAPGVGDAASGATGLDRLRALLRASPDHLPARAVEAIATKDPTKIAEFVRDHVTVLPGIGASDDTDLAMYSRWGAMPTLRAGAGSLRDRVDLMVQLLAAAGISSTVRAMKTPDTLTSAALYATRVNDFSVNLSELESVTGLSASAVPPDPPEASVESTGSFDATVSAILNAAQSSMTSLPKSDLPVPAHLPVVIPQASAPSSGNVLVLVAVADRAVATVDVATLVPATDTNISNIGITVSALMNPPAGAGSPTYVDLVTGSWPIDQVAGHQAQVVFLPRDGAAAALSDLSSQHVRIPVIRIQPRPGVGLDPYADDLLPPSMRSAGAAALDGGVPSMKNALGAAGSAFTIDGEVVAVSTPSAMDPNAPFVSLDDKAHTAAVASVAKIDASINATTFPTVELDLSISDAKGNSVDGLIASDLVVTEDGTAMPITLVANRLPSHPPRVLIAYDGSGSITQFWGTAAGRQAFDKSLATTLTNIAMQYPFEVQVIGLAGVVDPKGWAPPTVAGLTMPLDNAFSESDVWATFVGSAVDSGPAVIIMVSDFDDPDPTYIDAAKQHLGRSGIPVIAVTVGMVVESAVSQIVAASSGVEISASSPDLTSTVTSVVQKAVAQKATVGYRLRYDAPLSGKSTRSVKVALATKSSISATASYDVPAMDARIAPPSVVSVYVTISFAGVTERRRLGGAFLTDHQTPLDDVQSQAIIDDARSVLDGVTTIAIEPASPTVAQVLDDTVIAHQSMQPLLASWPPSDVNVLTKLAAKLYRFPALFIGPLLAPPAEDGAPVLVPRALRVAILSERSIGGKGIRQIDMPPHLNAMRSMTGGAGDLEAVVRASLMLSVNEALVFDDSAYGQLVNRPLVVVQPGGALPMDVMNAYKNAADAANLAHLVSEYDDWIRLVPTDGGTVAFWVVDPASGSVAAIDAASRGGAGSNWDTILFTLGFLAFCMGLPCSLGVMSYPIWCNGVTAAAVGLTVASLFTSGPTFPNAVGGIGTALGAAAKTAKSANPSLTGRNVFMTCFLVLLYFISLEST